jgi:hypothetical protein
MGASMRLLFALAVISAALDTDDQSERWKPHAPCGEYQAQADHYAIALETISDCMTLDSDASRVACTARILSEADL